MQLAPPVTSTLLLLLLCTVGASRESYAQVQTEPMRGILRIAPTAYPGLPRSVSRYLQRHGYSIPQSRYSTRPHNAIRGRFNNDSVQDWAVLASQDGYSRILVFWGGSAAGVTKLDRTLDSDWLQGVDGDLNWYSRGIYVVGREYILERHRRYGGPKPPPIRHEAINDVLLGKGSDVYYFDGKRWHTLQGSD